MKKKYNIAGIKIELNYHYNEYLKGNIESYLTDDQEVCEYSIEVFLCDEIKRPEQFTNSKMNPYIIFGEKERIIYALNSKDEVKELITHTNDYKHTKIEINPSLLKNPAEVEYVMLGVTFLEIALRNGFLPIHAAAVIYRGEAILFSAPSQTGKSTHAKIWKNTFNDVELLNDDKPLLKSDGERIFVYSSPFSGKTSMNQNKFAPLKSIIFLRQGLTNLVSVMTDDSKIENLMRNILRPDDEDLWDQVVVSINKLMNEIPIYQIEATMDSEAAIAVHDILYKENF
ncbi:MAG: hypothetical protein Q7I99_00055 [Acholeplasmataceae bacterium]|nr:hypothetical protein [Acholeplasmataceae bacterium]